MQILFDGNQNPELKTFYIRIILCNYGGDCTSLAPIDTDTELIIAKCSPLYITYIHIYMTVTHKN